MWLHCKSFATSCTFTTAGILIEPNCSLSHADGPSMGHFTLNLAAAACSNYSARHLSQRSFTTVCSPCHNSHGSFFHSFLLSRKRSPWLSFPILRACAWESFITTPSRTTSTMTYVGQSQDQKLWDNKTEGYFLDAFSILRKQSASKKESLSLASLQFGGISLEVLGSHLFLHILPY